MHGGGGKGKRKSARIEIIPLIDEQPPSPFPRGQ